MNQKILNKINSFTGKLAQLKFLQGISNGGMQVLPFIMVGSIASLLVGLPIERYQFFISNFGIAEGLQWIANCSTNIMGLLFMYFVTKAYAEVLEVKSNAIGLLGIATYLMLLPEVFIEDKAAITFDYLGAKGVILGIILSILLVRFYKYLISLNISIKLPENTPDYVSNSFSAIIPFFLIAFVVLFLRLLFFNFFATSVFEGFYDVIQIPLNAIVGDNIFSQVILSIIAQFLWVFGIHGSSIIDSLRGPILFGLDGMQQAAYAAGESLPNVMGMAFSYIYYTAIMYPAIAIAILIFAKSKRMRLVGKMALPASFFGISEPLVFGLPIILNPILAIPFIIVPSVVMSIAYFVTSIGLISAPIGVQVFNIPMVINGILNGSWKIAALQVILLILSIILWAPFIKYADKQAVIEEKGGDINA